MFGQFDRVPKIPKIKIGKNYKQMFQSIRLMVESTIELDSNEELQCFCSTQWWTGDTGGGKFEFIFLKIIDSIPFSKEKLSNSFRIYMNFVQIRRRVI